jgi:hypothetical protein
VGVILDVISGQNLIAVVTLNIPKAVDLTGMGVSQFFAAVQKKAGSSKISILRIWGHGITHYDDKFQSPYNKGNLKIGDDKIDADSVRSYEGSLGVITKLFEPKGSRVELRGCQAALGTGADMMLALANIWQTEVQGSERSQPLMTWVPPVLSARPNGTRPLPSATIVEYNDPSLKR